MISTDSDSLTGNVAPLRWEGGRLMLLDQRLLPGREVWIGCGNASEVAEAIRTMVVRGAPAIGVSAAFGMAMAARADDDLREAAKVLKASRPTAVNLAWAVDRMLGVKGGPEEMTAEAEAIFREDVEANMRMGRFGAELLGDRVTLLTHCNAGALATGGYGTALGVIRAAVESGRKVAVFVGSPGTELEFAL